MKLATLRHQASTGDLAAITTLLNQALNHRGIPVTAIIQGAALKLTLPELAWSQIQICLVLLSRELLSWPQLAWQQFDVVIVSDSGKILWHQAWDLTDPRTLPGLAHPEKPLSSPVHPPESTLPPVSNPGRAEEFGIPIQPMDRKTWQVLAAGSGLALLLMLSSQVTFLLSPLITLVHELGHAATAWVFGYPAIPAFDFLYGGGITLHGDRWAVMVWAIYGGLGYLAWRYRHNRLTLGCLASFTVVYTMIAFSPVHQMLFLAMGHGFELIFAGIFLYRALSGFSCRYPIERLLYGMIGFFIVFYDLRFAWRLMFDPVEQGVYLEGKGGLLDHDFVRLAREFFHVDLAVVAALFWWLVLLTPVFIFFLYRYRQLMLFGFARLFLWPGENHSAVS